LVTKGFSQQEYIDYTETFSPIAKMNSVRLIISLVACFGWKIHEMGVKSVFLHGDISEEIFMEQPPGFATDSNLVCRLKKSLYGLKQAPRAWYAKIDSFFLRLVVIAICATLYASCFGGLPFPSIDSISTFFSIQSKKFNLLCIYASYS
jgi:hypothetical protein